MNEQIEKLGKNYMNEDGNVCIGIGYKWAVYGDILSLLVSVDFDWDATEYTIYNINLKKDVMLSEDDLLGAVNLDISAYESAVRNALDQHTMGFSSDEVLDLLMISKYYERIGDHATNIGEWAEFSVTGIHRNGACIRDLFNPTSL